MTRCILLVPALCLMVPPTSPAQMPPGFSWVNLESNTSVMATVRGALHDPSMTALREVGIEGNFALVMTASRSSGESTADADAWTVYSISLTSGQKNVLLRGYRLQMLQWIGPGAAELAITYDSCSGCEPLVLFTTLRMDPNVGWMARWPGEGLTDSSPQPGAGVVAGGVGEPYDDDEVSQVFGLIVQKSGQFAAGSWVRTRHERTRKIEDYVVRYSVDPMTAGDRVERLHGVSAVSWEREICTPSEFLIAPSLGQDSAACRNVIRHSRR